MSNWTHVYGIIDCYGATETNYTIDKYYLDKIVKKLENGEIGSAITGSEEDVRYYINHDIKAYPDVSMDYQHFNTRYFITIVGDLRDRTMEETKQEVKKMVNELPKWLNLRDIRISITQDFVEKEELVKNVYDDYDENINKIYKNNVKNIITEYIKNNSFKFTNVLNYINDEELLYDFYDSLEFAKGKLDE